MASGYLNLAYLIEISVVFNLAYREIKHGIVLEKMKKIREKMFRDEEFQERIKEIKKDSSLGSNTVESSYEKLIAITEFDGVKSKDCKNTDDKLCQAWNYNKSYCKYFVNIILTGKDLVTVNYSIGMVLMILLFATIFPHTNMNFDIFIWWFLFVVLVITIFIPIYLLGMSEKVDNILIGKKGKKGLIPKSKNRTTHNQKPHQTSKKVTTFNLCNS